MRAALLSVLLHHKALLLPVVLVVAGMAVLLGRLVVPSAGEKVLRRLQAKTTWVPLCIALLGGYLLMLFSNLIYPGYLEHVEPSIASVAYIFLHGAPLYHALDSVQRYAFPYGPMGFLPYALALRAMGASVFPLKVIVLLANLAMLWLLWNSYRRILDAPRALLVGGCVIAYLLMSGDYVLQVRGDILIVFCVALALFAVLGRSAVVSACLFSVACAFAFDTKITAVFYLFPLFALLVRRHGWRLAALSASASAVLALVPFVSARISLAGYLQWLKLLSHEPLARIEVLRELPMLLLLCSPVALLLWQLAQRKSGAARLYLSNNRGFVVTLVVSVGGVAVSASKIGAGPHHFMPFYPIFGYLCADIYHHTQDLPMPGRVSPGWGWQPLLWSWLVIAVAMNDGIAAGPAALTLLTGKSLAVSVCADLESVMKDYPNKTIEMGYGGWNPKYKLTYYRPALVFAGNPYTIDAMALGDMQLAGVPIPPGTLQYLQACKTQIWLIPKGDQPFAMVNVYSLMDPHLFPERMVFSDGFRQIFLERYQKRASSEYFDIWECNAQS